MPDQGGYLPPVDVRITGDAADLIRALQDAKARLAAFARDAARARLGADDGPLIRDLQAARVQVNEFTRHNYTIRVDADTSEALAQVAALRAEIDAMKADMKVGTDSSGGGFLRRMFGGKGSTRRLMWGRGLLGMAGFGTVGSLAGFGPEHLMAVGAGLAGFAAEGAAGAGLLGLGSAGVMGAGMLADSAGIGQALGDVRKYNAGLNNLNQAIQLYGRNSIQARRAQLQLNNAMAGVAPATVKAIASLNSTANAFHMMYDKMTSPAEAIGARILQQGVNTGRAFLPELGKAATRNMGTMQKGLQPLFGWMKSGNGGLGIFTNLENIFSARLPMAVRTFSNAIEVLLKTINHIAPQTGGLLKVLDKLFARMNTPAGFAKWSKEVDKLIGDFRLLEKFFKALGHDLHSVMKDSAGEPAAIITTLTKGLQKLGKWLDSVKGKGQVKLLFQVHMQEILGIIKAVGQLGKIFGNIYLQVAPSFVTAVNTVLKALNPLLSAFAKNPVGAWVMGLGLLAAKFSPLGNLIKTLVPRLGAMVAGMIGLTAAEGAETTASGAASVAAGVLNIALGVGVVGAIIAIVIAIVELIKHWKTVSKFIERVAKDIAGFAKRMWHDVSGFVERMWHDVTGFVSRIYHDVINWFKRMWNDIKSGLERFAAAEVRGWQRLWHDVTGFVKRIWNDVTGWFKRMWNDIKTGVERGVNDVIKWFKSLPGKIAGFFSDAGSWLLNAGKAIISGLWNGLKSAWKDVTGFFSGIGSWISKHKGPIEVDRQLLVPHGKAIMAGLYQGLSDGYTGVRSLVGDMGAGLSSGLSVSVGGASSREGRIEALLTQILAAAKDSGESAKQTVRNTGTAVTVMHGLSSPAGVQAQIRQGNGELLRSVRAL